MTLVIIFSPPAVGKLEAGRHYRLNTKASFFYPERHLRIDNTGLAPDIVAARIVERFQLPVRSV